MNDKRDPAPDSTAARVALWRALHVEAGEARTPMTHVLRLAHSIRIQLNHKPASPSYKHPQAAAADLS